MYVPCRTSLLAVPSYLVSYAYLASIERSYASSFVQLRSFAIDSRSSCFSGLTRPFGPASAIAPRDSEEVTPHSGNAALRVSNIYSNALTIIYRITTFFSFRTCSLELEYYRL